MIIFAYTEDDLTLSGDNESKELDPSPWTETGTG